MYLSSYSLCRESDPSNCLARYYQLRSYFREKSEGLPKLCNWLHAGRDRRYLFFFDRLKVFHEVIKKCDNLSSFKLAGPVKPARSNRLLLNLFRYLFYLMARSMVSKRKSSSSDIQCTIFLSNIICSLIGRLILNRPFGKCSELDACDQGFIPEHESYNLSPLNQIIAQYCR